MFLDVLRFFAAAAVLLQHSLETQGHWGSTFCEYVSPGVFGVVLFFVISGYVIPMASEANFNLRTFVIRRLFRIYPLVLFAFGLIAITGSPNARSLFETTTLATARDWTSNLLLIQEYTGNPPILGVTWTLSIEFAWYAIFAISYLLLGRQFDELLVIVAPLGMFILAAVSIRVGHRLPLGHVGMIYLAVIGCRAYRYSAGHLGPRRFAFDVAIFIATTMFSNIVSFGYFRHPNITMMEAVVPWVVGPGLFLLVSSVPQVNGSPVFVSKSLGQLGKISFSTFLLHPIALTVANAYVPLSLSLFAGWLGTLLLSIIGYRFVEVPGQALGRTISRLSSAKYLFMDV